MTRYGHLRALAEMAIVVAVTAGALIAIGVWIAGCGASALETHATTIRVLDGAADIGEQTVKDLAAPRYQSCRDTWQIEPEHLEVCADAVTAEYMPAAVAVDTVKHAVGLYATAVVAAEDGVPADLLALASKAVAAYHAMLKALEALGVHSEPVL